MALYMSKKIEL